MARKFQSIEGYQYQRTFPCGRHDDNHSIPSHAYNVQVRTIFMVIILF